MLKSPNVLYFLRMTDARLLFHQVCGCPEASSHSKCLIYSRVPLNKETFCFCCREKKSAQHNKSHCMFCYRPDVVIVLNGDQSFFFPGMDLH